MKCNADTNKEIAKEVNKKMRLIQKQYAAWLKIDKPSKPESHYNALESIKGRLLDAYRASNKFKHMNHRSVLLFIKLNNSLRAVPFHQVEVNKELLS